MVRSSAVNTDMSSYTLCRGARLATSRLAMLAATCLLVGLLTTVVSAAERVALRPGTASPPVVEFEELDGPSLPSLEPLFDPPKLVISPSDQRAAASCSLWLVSSRAAGCGLSLEDLDLYRYAPGCGWSTSNMAAFLTEDSPEVPTIFFVHGNRYTAEDALETGETLYHSIAAMAPAHQPVRFVIWSWPSGEIDGHQIKDLRTKALRAEWQGIQLAQFVAAIDPNVRIALLGHSYGSRLLSSSLHVMGGGEIAGHRLDAPIERNVPLRVVLMAAAMGNQWLLPGERHGEAMNAADEVLVIANSKDKVLRWYPRLFPGPGPEALGYSGITMPGRLGPHYEKVEQIDVANLIGKEHNLVDYYHTPAIWRRVSNYALFAPGS